MKPIDWYYHRSGCDTCKKSQAYLKEHAFDVRKTVSTAKEKYTADDLPALLKGIDTLHVMRGRRMLSFDMSSKASRPGFDELEEYLLGRSGTLRAPVLRQGKTMFVGFNEENFAPLLR